MWYSATPEGVTIDVLVQPRASKERFGPLQGDRVKVGVTAPPVDGAANAAVVDYLAKVFAIRRSEVVILSGLRGRRKTLFLRGVSVTSLLDKVSP